MGVRDLKIGIFLRSLLRGHFLVEFWSDSGSFETPKTWRSCVRGFKNQVFTNARSFTVLGCVGEVVLAPN